MDQNCPQIIALLDELKSLQSAFHEGLPRAIEAKNFDDLNKLRGEIRKRFYEIDRLFVTAEMNETLNRLEIDYHQSIDALRKFNILHGNNRFYYSADFGDFRIQDFYVPEWEKIRKSITRPQLLAIMEMKRNNRQPKLFLVPIGMKVSTLGKAVDDRRVDLNLGSLAANNVLDRAIKDQENSLTYFPQSLSYDPDKGLTVAGGQTKADLIRKNGGWLVTIAETVPRGPANPELKDNEWDGRKDPWVGLITGEKVAMHHQYRQKKDPKGQLHLTGLTTEDLFAMKMVSLLARQGSDDYSNILDGAILPDPKEILFGRLSTVNIAINPTELHNINTTFRVRTALRIKLKYPLTK